MLIVVDANVLIACALNEPERDRLLAITSGQTLVAPESLPFELGNAFSAMFKRRKLEVDEALAAFELCKSIRVVLQPVDVAAAIRLSARLGIYAYDAYVLECAMTSGGRLLTLDGGLRTAARAVRAEVIEVPT